MNGSPSADSHAGRDLAGPWDAVVIGSGPAGSATAFYLARHGRRVVVCERKRLPRDKSCGDGLTPHCVNLLDDMGVLPALAAGQRIGGVRVVMPDSGPRDFLYSSLRRRFNYGLVVPRLSLDHQLSRAAVGAGAVVAEGFDVESLEIDGGRVVGVVARTPDGSTTTIRAAVTVAADGANSSMRRHAGLSAPDDMPLGFAVRGYFGNIRNLERLLEIRMPLTDLTDRYVLPSYGWIFPTGPEEANIGVGLFSDVGLSHVRELYDRFIADLTATDPRMTEMRPLGRSLGAPLRFDFNPERCSAPGLLLVGDAAGLVSPFTGEGISYALESAKLAADTIDRCLRLSPIQPPIEDDYRTLVGHHFAGYFEMGRRSAQRYQLLWRVLESTFDSDRPIFHVLRRLALVPEGAGAPTGEDVLDDLSPLLPRSGLKIRQQLLQVGIALASTLRADWPFLSQHALAGRTTNSVVLRPSLLFLICTHFGSYAEEDAISVAAALDLAYLAILAQSGIEEETGASGKAERKVNWGNKFAVLLSDFLLARSYERIGPMEASAGRRVLQAFERACSGHLDQSTRVWDVTISEDEHLGHLRNKFATMFELPCVLAAELAGVPALVPMLQRYGEGMGLAYALTEDIRTIEMPEHRLSSAFVSDISAGVMSLPFIKALQNSDGGDDQLRILLQARSQDTDQLHRIVRDAHVLDETRRQASMFAQEAVASLSGLTPQPARIALERLAEYAASRTVPDRLQLA